ncbi:protein kinase domain-containing protein [Nannocystaceae bacterium ST9]
MTSPRPPEPSLDEARIYQSIKARLFGIHDEPVRIARHRLLRRLGAGGMGEVFLAHDDELDRPVAVKLVHAKLGHDARFADRMRREARALAKLTHPNVVHVYEVGEHEGRFFLTMEYVEGRSLGQWIRESAPQWAEVIDAYLAAGEGLAAAHAAGLTHRDFKPDNVLRGDDGRICVADFGLARASATPDSNPELEHAFESGEGQTLDERLSATGAVMGTPHYMPLEQLRGGVVDARSDQFAFCVALYEGLWGTRPHPANDLHTRELALADDRPEVPRPGPVPSWVWPIVRRGLARDPERRWPDMRSLLDRLRAAPRRRRAGRRAAFVALGLPLVLAGGWLGLAPDRELAVDPCRIDESALAGVWDDASRRAVRRAFEASGLTIAGEASTRVERALDAWSSSWIAEQVDSCEATRVRGTQSEAMLDRRTRCFERRRGEVEALVEVFAAADAGVVAHAGQALLGLPDLGACELASLAAEPQPSVAPLAREHIDAGYEALARARVELGVGRPSRATELARTARALGETHEHDPLALEARALLAEIMIERGELGPGLEQLREVVLAAERAGLFDLVASTRVELARAAAGDFAEPRLERWLIDEAQLALDRIGRPGDPRAVTLQTARARIAEQAGDFAAAIAAHEAAYELADGWSDEGRRAMLQIGIGTARHRNGDLEGARALLEQSLAAVRAAWGRSAPEAARIEFDLAMVDTDLGELELARRHLDSAIAIDEAVWGRGSIEVARDRFALAYLEFARGEIDSGCVIIDEVLGVYEAELGRIHDETASAINAAAVCRFYAEDFVGALAGYRSSLAIQTELLGEHHREIGLLHANIGEVQFALGQRDESLASHTRALAILTAKLPEDHPELAPSLCGQALVWLETGESERALAALERALAIADASQPLELAEIRFGLARALVGVQGRRGLARARELAGMALEDFEIGGSERRARAVRDWLAAPPR